MNRLFKLIFTFSLLIFAVFITSSCNKDKENNFYIACEKAAEPFAYYDKNGDLTGFEIELIKAIALNQDIKIKLQPLDFNRIMFRFTKNNPRIDGAISLITWTYARGENISFSHPYFNSGMAIAVKKGRDDIHTLDDLKGKTVAMKEGTLINDYAEMIKDSISFTVTPFLLLDDAFTALLNGEADAVLEEYPLIDYRVKKGMNIDVAYISEQNQMFSLAVKNGKSKNLIRHFNEGLLNLQENGTYESIYNKYFTLINNE